MYLPTEPCKFSTVEAYANVDGVQINQRVRLSVDLRLVFNGWINGGAKWTRVGGDNWCVRAISPWMDKPVLLERYNDWCWVNFDEFVPM